MESDFRERFFEERITLLDDILAYSKERNIKGRQFWSLSKTDARFHLGESDLNIRIPHIFGGASEEIFEDAVRDLATLVRERIEPPMVYDDRGGIVVSTLDENVKLAHKTFKIGGAFYNRAEHELAMMVLYSDPLLDAGILETWLSSRFNGRKFIGEIRRIYKKSIEEEMQLGGGERTAYITHLAVSKILIEKKALLKNIRIMGVNYERLERSIGVLFYAVIYKVIEHILKDLRTKRLSYDIREMEYLLLGSTTPLFALNIKKSIINFDLNNYLLSPVVLDWLEEPYNEAARKSMSVRDLLARMVGIMLEDKSITERLLDYYTLSNFRDDIIDYLLRFDNQTDVFHQRLVQIVHDEKTLRAVWENLESSRELEFGLSDMVDRYYRDEARVTKIRQIISHFRSHKRGGISRLFSSGDSGIEFKLSDILKRYIVYRMDVGYDSHFSAMTRCLVNRKKELTLQHLVREYDAGRLYRFSGDHKVSLMKREELKEGHLFVDMKGFTRRAKRSGSLIIADFLKHEFFAPILDSAKSHYLNVGPDYTSGIELNNLLGDAITFSGPVSSLVSLAWEIYRIARDFREKIVKDNPEYDENSQINTLQVEYEQQRERINKHSTQIVEALLTLNSIIKTKRSIAPTSLIEVQSGIFREKIEKLIESLSDVSLKIQKYKTMQEIKDLVQLEDDLRFQLSVVKSTQEEFLREVELQKLSERSSEVYMDICQDELKQIKRLIGMLDNNFRQEQLLTQSYYERLGEIADLGINTGLYIAFGDVSQKVIIHDDLWGDVRVSIADKINEASRGAKRNRAVKKRMDRFVQERRQKSNNPGLVYPFSIIIAPTYTVIQPVGNESMDRPRGIRTFVDYAQELIGDDAEERILSQDLSEIIRSEELFEQDLVSSTTDVYNLGEAISGDALRQYIRESQNRLFFFERRVYAAELHKEFWNLFAYDGDDIYLIFGVEHTGDTTRLEMFRYVGVLDYAGTFNREVTEVYEMIRPESAFFRFIMGFHFHAWYQNSRSMQEADKGNMGA
ncbi:MAG: hypothetical protein JW885_05505 [Deltaproteobacteria bacterium]|nr:hypothetical protein [Candidatus Zymogenaceae bacterium]